VCLFLCASGEAERPCEKEEAEDDTSRVGESQNK
jgi:hypothetical protein